MGVLSNAPEAWCPHDMPVSPYYRRGNGDLEAFLQARTVSKVERLDWAQAGGVQGPLPYARLWSYRGGEVSFAFPGTRPPHLCVHRALWASFEAVGASLPALLCQHVTPPGGSPQSMFLLPCVRCSGMLGMAHGSPGAQVTAEGSGCKWWATARSRALSLPPTLTLALGWGGVCVEDGLSPGAHPQRQVFR